MAPAAALLAAFALGLLCGAMLLIALVLVPWWRQLEPAAFVRWFQDQAPVLGRVMIPLGAASALLALTAAVLAGVARRPGARWLGLAAGLALAVGALYPLYFSGANAMLTGGSLSAQEVSAELERWRVWHGLRVALGLGAFLAALRGVR